MSNQMDVAGRVPRLVAELESAGCDALVVTSLSNVRYLTGFTGSAGMVLVGEGRTVLLTDGRYRTQAAEQLGQAGVEAELFIGTVPEQRRALADAIGSRPGVRTVGLEAAVISWAGQRSLEGELAPARLVPTESLVERLRRVKDPGELERMAAAASIADQALAEVLDLLVDGRTEAEIALALDSAVRRLGADGVAFETIVAAGPNGAKPHARPSGRPVEAGELVVIDFGALVDGYRSDMTRTFSVGAPRHEEMNRMFTVVAEAQLAGVDAVVAGVPAAEVDRRAREVIGEAGWAEYFVHSTGHGVGLDIHEAPAVSATSADTLEAASVVTVEPGVYLPAWGGVRIEDTLVVTTEGRRALTRFPKDLVLA